MTRFDSEHSNSPPHAREFVGRFLVLFGVAVVLLYFLSNRPGVRLPLPGFWYRGGELWPFMGVVAGIAGFLLQRDSQTISRKWKPSVPGTRFQRVVVYSREDCHLCDVAKDSLHKFSAWLPEIEEIDIDDSPELIEQYGTEIPVISFDGVERFRGFVNEQLIKRLIEGTAPRSSSQQNELAIKEN